MTEGAFDFDFGSDHLRGQTVLVSGGSGGLGSAVCCLLAQDGAHLVVGYRSNLEKAARLKDHLTTNYGVEVELVAGDIADQKPRTALVEAARSLPGDFTAMVCLVGDPARVKFADARIDDLEASLRANFIGPVLLARDAASAMLSAGVSGSIVLFSTMQALDIFSGSLSYAAPKAALIHAARILAKDWGGPSGIRVNVVAPGVNRAGMALASISSGKYDPFLEKGIVPRFGHAEDVARVVRLLVEPDNYLTGQVIAVDGGLTLRKDLG